MNIGNALTSNLDKMTEQERKRYRHFLKTELIKVDQAYDNLIKYYKIWNKAFDGLSWTNYMNKLLELNETGSWVKEVINAELKTVI